MDANINSDMAHGAFRGKRAERPALLQTHFAPRDDAGGPAGMSLILIFGSPAVDFRKALMLKSAGSIPTWRPPWTG
jgi:hypothetical protein